MPIEDRFQFSFETTGDTLAARPVQIKATGTTATIVIWD